MIRFDVTACSAPVRGQRLRAIVSLIGCSEYFDVNFISILLGGEPTTRTPGVIRSPALTRSTALTRSPCAGDR